MTLIVPDTQLPAVLARLQRTGRNIAYLWPERGCTGLWSLAVTKRDDVAATVTVTPTRDGQPYGLRLNQPRAYAIASRIVRDCRCECR